MIQPNSEIARHLTAIAQLVQTEPVELATPAAERIPADFDVAFERLVGHEGGFQNHRNDRGNWTTGIVGQGELRGTKYGITAMTYPHLDIRNLTLEDAKHIYRKDFWTPLAADELDGRVSFNLFDAAVHHGQARAIQMLQQVVEVADDGHMGPITLEATNARLPGMVVARLNANRLLFCTRLSTWPAFGAGWTRRFAVNILEGTE